MMNSNTTADPVRIAGQEFPTDIDPVIPVLNAVGAIVAPAGSRWIARRNDIFDPTLPNAVATYAWEKIIEPGADVPAGAGGITPAVIARVLETQNAHLTTAGERWYSDSPDGGADVDGRDLESGDVVGFPAGTVARALIFRMDDETARDYDLLP